MRRFTTPLVVLLLTAVVVMLGVGLLREDTSDPAARQAASTKGGVAPGVLLGEQRTANEVILASVPLPPGSRFYTRNDVPAPRGGTNSTTHLYFASSAGPKAIVDHFKTTLAGAGWTLVGELSFPSRQVAKFQKGDAWFEMAATDIDIAGQKTPGFTVIVNAKDAKVFATL